MSFQRIAILVGIFLVLVLIRWGCNWDATDLPPLGQVTGKVTLDGKPWAGIIIAFYPEKGRMATATVDESGSYTMMYTGGVAGTILGRNGIHFVVPTSGYAGPPLPAHYGDQSTLTVDVTEGKNKYDFDLKSEPPASSDTTGTANPSGRRNTTRKTPETQGAVD